MAAVAPGVGLAEIAHARRASPNADAVQRAWRAQGLLNDGISKGQQSLMLDAIETAHQAIVVDPALLSAHGVPAWSHNFCHLYRWGPEPGKTLGALEHAQGNGRAREPAHDQALDRTKDRLTQDEVERIRR